MDVCGKVDPLKSNPGSDGVVERHCFIDKIKVAKGSEIKDVQYLDDWFSINKLKGSTISTTVEKNSDDGFSENKYSSKDDGEIYLTYKHEPDETKPETPIVRSFNVVDGIDSTTGKPIFNIVNFEDYFKKTTTSEQDGEGLSITTSVSPISCLLVDKKGEEHTLCVGQVISQSEPFTIYVDDIDNGNATVSDIRLTGH